MINKMYSYEVIGLDEKEAVSLYNFAKRRGYEPSKNVELSYKAVPGSKKYYTVSSKYGDFSICVAQWRSKTNPKFSQKFYKVYEQVKGA